MSGIEPPKVNIPASKENRGALWWVLASVGSLSVIIGIVIGSKPVANLCGSVFDQESFAAKIYDTLEGSPGGAFRECAQKISAAAVPTWIFLLLGIVLIVAGIIIRYMPKKQSVTFNAAPTEKSITEKIEELDNLRQRGLVSKEEFELKRKDLLDRM